MSSRGSETGPLTRQRSREEEREDQLGLVRRAEVILKNLDALAESLGNAPISCPECGATQALSGARSTAGEAATCRECGVVFYQPWTLQHDDVAALRAVVQGFRSRVVADDWSTSESSKSGTSGISSQSLGGMSIQSGLSVQLTSAGTPARIPAGLSLQHP